MINFGHTACNNFCDVTIFSNLVVSQNLRYWITDSNYSRGILQNVCLSNLMTSIFLFCIKVFRIEVNLSKSTRRFLMGFTTVLKLSRISRNTNPWGSKEFVTIIHTNWINAKKYAPKSSWKHVSPTFRQKWFWARNIKLKKPRKTWISFFASLNNLKKKWISFFFASLKNLEFNFLQA